MATLALFVKITTPWMVATVFLAERSALAVAPLMLKCVPSVPSAVSWTTENVLYVIPAVALVKVPQTTAQAVHRITTSLTMVESRLACIVVLMA
jgi:hypothetical protein